MARKKLPGLLVTTRFKVNAKSETTRGGRRFDVASRSGVEHLADHRPQRHRWLVDVLIGEAEGNVVLIGGFLDQTIGGDFDQRQVFVLRNAETMTLAQRSGFC